MSNSNFDSIIIMLENDELSTLRLVAEDDKHPLVENERPNYSISFTDLEPQNVERLIEAMQKCTSLRHIEVIGNGEPIPTHSRAIADIITAYTSYPKLTRLMFKDFGGRCIEDSLITMIEAIRASSIKVLDLGCLLKELEFAKLSPLVDKLQQLELVSLQLEKPTCVEPNWMKTRCPKAIIGSRKLPMHVVFLRTAQRSLNELKPIPVPNFKGNFSFAYTLRNANMQARRKNLRKIQAQAQLIYSNLDSPDALMIDVHCDILLGINHSDRTKRALRLLSGIRKLAQLTPEYPELIARADELVQLSCHYMQACHHEVANLLEGQSKEHSYFHKISQALSLPEKSSNAKTSHA